MLAMAHPSVWPSLLGNGVGTPIAFISQLHTLPACTPVNASMAALRLATHDSGPGWVATPFLYRTFIDYPSPVSLAHYPSGEGRLSSVGLMWRD